MSDELFFAFCAPAKRDAAAKDTAILASARVTQFAHRQILRLPPEDVPPIQLTGYAWGDAAAPAVLLAHGWEFQSGRMAAFVQPLLSAGYRVVAFDFPAHGRSEGEYGTMVDFAEAIANAIDAFGNVHAVVGHSFGGQSAAWLFSHRHYLAVQRLVMIAAASSVEYLAEVSGPIVNASDADRAAFHASFERRMGAPMRAFDVPGAASHIQIPTLIIHDKRDLMVPYSHAEAYASAIPHATLMTTTGLGHRAILRAEEVVRAIVAFVEKGA